jgi:streptogramin lyase
LSWLRARNGLSHDFVLTVFEDRRGTLWFGTLDGLTRWDGRSLHRFRVEDGLPGSVVRSVVEDRAGALWVGTNGGVARFDGKAFRSFKAGDEVSEDAVNVLYLDDSGRLWAGTAAGLSVLDGDRFAVVSRALSIPEASVYAIRQQPENGDLWVGLYGRGLVRIPQTSLETTKAPSSPQTKSLSSRDVLEMDRVVSLAFDADGDLWVGTELGIDLLHLRRRDVSGRPAVSHWGLPLGPERIECIHNASFADSRGRVWMGTLTGPLLFEPRRQQHVAAPLRVTLTAAGLAPGGATWMSRVRRTGAGSLPRLELGPDDNRAAFAFEAVSLSAPSRVRYQFKLEGYDSDWSPATTTAQAFYPDLPPGEFQFKVRATRDGRTWFEAPQPFQFRVLAPLQQRAWFQVLCVLAGALLVYGGHRVSVGRLRTHQRKLQSEVLERQRVERDLATTNRALRVRGGCNRALARATEEPQLLDEICRLVVEIGG